MGRLLSSRAQAAGLSLMLAVLFVCGRAAAQTTVDATAGSEVTQTVSAGQSLSAGTFSIANSSGLNVTLSSVSVNLTDSNMFSSLTLTVQIGTNTSTFTISSPTTGDNDVSLSGLATLDNTQTASFSLTANISSNPSMLDDPSVAYAAFGKRLPINNGPGSLLLAISLAGLAAGLLLRPSTGRAWFRLLLAALALSLALTEASCGDQLPFGSGGGGSTQTIDAASGTDSNGNAITVSGLPLTLSDLTLSTSSSTTTTF